MILFQSALPYLQLKSGTDDDGDGLQEFEGFIADLLLAVSRHVGFNYTIRLVRDGRYGSRTADGTWNGMIGELLRRVRRVNPPKLRSRLCASSAQLLSLIHI